VRSGFGLIPTWWLLALMASTMSCNAGERSTREEIDVDAPDVITVSSPAFKHGQPIPARFTCDGDDQPPPLAWDGVPEAAAAVALIVDDPDAPRGTFVHWALLDIPNGTTELDADTLPASAVQAKNSAGRASYFGPCPPSGRHHYRFTIYALAQRTGLRDGAELDEALHAVESTATAQGRLVGTYRRSG
jgi:Raf kinase inhibitor-like YbhB/YbcL family protein